ncbi:hypothetical protein ACFSTD_14020 [Novosphingobium colocasiae]
MLALYDVTAIAASAPAPFEEIHQDVLQAWALETGSAGAKAAALKVQAALRAGKSLQQAVAAAGKPLPPAAVDRDGPSPTDDGAAGRQAVAAAGDAAVPHGQGHHQGADGGWQARLVRRHPQ